MTSERRRPAGPTATGRIRMTGLLAAVAAIVLTIAPPGGPIATFAAADPNLRFEAATTYTLDPAAGAVHVAIDVKVTNRKPNSSLYEYYYTNITLGIHEEASAVAARDGRGALRTKVTDEDGYRVVDVRFRSSIFYNRSASFRITYDLVGGAPRSDATTRAGLSFASFDVFAWGDPGRSSVTVHLPAGFEPELYGDPIVETEGPDGVTLTAASVADPDEFWVGVVAIAEDAYATEAIDLEGDVRLEIRAWPEDEEWAATVIETMREGLPSLRELIGLDWPVDDVLTVTEIHSVLMSGYAGVYFTQEDRIEISEDLDELTALHEASHAWFNDDLFLDRWINEGLAETYSAIVWKELGGKPEEPTRPRASEPGRRDLVDWRHPGRIDDEATEDYESYGYNASYWVVQAILAEVGEDGMRAVFAAAESDEVAYLGAVEPEKLRPSDDWRRFLDLLEERADAERVEALFRDFVLGPAGERELDERSAARALYAALVEDGDGWLPPWLIRQHMERWVFNRATEEIEAARAVLALRDEVEAAAAELGLTPGDDFETAYETATDDLEATTATGEALLDALEGLAAARATLDAEPDLFATVGLIGETPEVPYDEATAAFEADDPDGATEAAAKATAIVIGATDVGRGRVLVAVVSVGGLVLLIAAIVLVDRRRRRRRARMFAVAVAASATLAASQETSPDAATDARLEGGTAEGADAGSDVASGTASGGVDADPPRDGDPPA